MKILGIYDPNKAVFAILVCFACVQMSALRNTVNLWDLYKNTKFEVDEQREKP